MKNWLIKYHDIDEIQAASNEVKLTPRCNICLKRVVSGKGTRAVTNPEKVKPTQLENGIFNYFDSLEWKILIHVYNFTLKYFESVRFIIRLKTIKYLNILSLNIQSF